MVLLQLIQKFLEILKILKHIFSTFLQELRDAPKAKGQSRIYTHGEKEIEAVKDRMENGIDVDVKTVLEMKDLSNYVGVDFEKYFGKLDIEDDGYKTVY